MVSPPAKGGPKERVLWVDGLGGLIVGFVVLVLHPWLSDIEGLPKRLVLFMALCNLAYGTYSTSLARRSMRSVRSVAVLAAANFAWLFVCLAIAYANRESITALGALHVVGEGLYVGGLGIVEWFLRRDLSRPTTGPG